MLCFDEVMTGFRIAKGCAQEYFGVTPDLTTMGKVRAGGTEWICGCGLAEMAHRGCVQALQARPVGAP